VRVGWGAAAWATSDIGFDRPGMVRADLRHGPNAAYVHGCLCAAGSGSTKRVRMAKLQLAQATRLVIAIADLDPAGTVNTVPGDGVSANSPLSNSAWPPAISST
jgi:hypothetical protein